MLLSRAATGIKLMDALIKFMFNLMESKSSLPPSQTLSILNFHPTSRLDIAHINGPFLPFHKLLRQTDHIPTIMGSKQATTASFVKSAPPGEVGEEVKLYRRRSG